MRFAGLLLLVGAPMFSGCATSAMSARASSLAREPVPAVVVTVVVDQLAAWVADQRLPLLPAEGGFARLRREGTWFHRMEYPYAATDTAPGHATLYTGQLPRTSGIFANEVPTRIDQRVSILRDETSHVLTAEGPASSAGSSLARLRVPTLADVLHARRPAAPVVSLSLKDRGALFGCGRTPAACLYFDPGRGAFVTSTAVAQTFPAWARPLATVDATATSLGPAWTLADPAWIARHATGTDDAPGEGDLDGWGRTFPHRFATARAPALAFRASPAGDLALLALAEAAVHSARVPGEPLLLSLSLSSNDYVGHVFGPDAWEAWDQLYRLDAALARFLTTLDREVGRDGWALVLTGDHGVGPLPERGASFSRAAASTDAATGPAVRLDPDVLGRLAQEEAVATLGPGAWVRGVADPFLWFGDAALALPAPAFDGLVARVAARLRAVQGLVAVIDTRTVDDVCPDETDESLAARVCRTVPRPSEPRLVLVPAPGCFFETGYVPGSGANHGTPYAYDRTVPLLVREPDRRDAGRSVDARVGPRAFSAAAARWLGLGAAGL